jgi:hypothetical protein
MNFEEKMDQLSLKRAADDNFVEDDRTVPALARKVRQLEEKVEKLIKAQRPEAYNVTKESGEGSAGAAGEG